MALKLSAHFGTTKPLVSEQTIVNHLDKALYSYKVAQVEPTARNTPETKAKRIQYLRDLTEVLNLGFLPVFMDETGFDLWCHRRHGRSPRGTRARVYVPSSPGGNVTLVAAISPFHGLIHHTTRHGSQHFFV